MIRDFVFLSKSNPGGKNILPQRRNSQENDQGMLCFSLKSNPGLVVKMISSKGETLKKMIRDFVFFVKIKSICRT